MSDSIQYIGPTKTFKNTASLNPQILEQPEITLTNGEFYNIDVQLDGPMIQINGRQVIQDDTPVWVVLSTGRIPYYMDCLRRHWKIQI